jgi:tRNA modification GTPase
LDLTRAEAVLGVIDATDAGELSTALAQLAGGLARPLQRLREDMLQLLAELEAGLDFVEEDIEFISRNELFQRLNAADEQLARVAQQLKTRRAPAEMNQVVLVGQPNVGKSSLFNAIVQHCGTNTSAGAGSATAALVSPERGTTRDYLTATISLDGIDCTLVDTAGVEPIQNGASTIEGAAQELSADRRRRANVRICCIEATCWNTESANAILCGADSACNILALTKAALIPAEIRNGLAVIATSSRNGTGIDELCQAIRKRLSRDATLNTGGAIAPTAERCGESIRQAGIAIRAASSVVEAGAGEELVASELRVALAERTVYTDDLLDRIFRTFCIGK